MSEEHENFIKTPKQLIIIVVLAFIVPIALFLLLSQLMTGEKKMRPGEQAAAVAERIKPIGELAIAGPKVLLTGDKVYETVCQTCHAAGLAGAPKVGDTAAWAKVVKGGQALAFARAIAGIQEGGKVMPPRGGNSELTDEEVAGAVVFMANQSGAKWTAPELKMPVAVPAQAAASPATAPAAAIALPAMPSMPVAAAAVSPQASAAGGKGKAVYDATCTVCHAGGIAGSPKIGDKAVWAPRIATGIEALYTSALKGKNAMPPKGGNIAIPDGDVKAAVDYMVAQAK